MKKNDLILISAVAIYSSLFYGQVPGLNCLIFTMCLLVLLVSRNPDITRKYSWIAAAAGALISAACLFIYGNGLSLAANIISLCLVSAFSINPSSSLISSLFFSVASVVSSPAFMVFDAIQRQKQVSENKKRSPILLRLLLYVVPILVLLLFFVIYKASNTVFDTLTSEIKFDFISGEWLAFTFGGLVLMYGFFYHRHVKMITAMDETAPGTLKETQPLKFAAVFQSIGNEILSGTILLLLLNLLLLALNTVDVVYLWSGSRLPRGMTYAQFVHQGTELLVLSIIIAIAIIMFYFRDGINFYQKNKVLKWLAYAWIIQNVFMLVSTAWRNQLYILEYSLTYKRIGVYVWLLLAFLGLCTTLVKIAYKKSNWFLYRSNAWLFYAVLVLSCIINWPAFVTDYNISAASQKHKPADREYLLSLSSYSIPVLLAHEQDSREVMHTENERRQNNYKERLGNAVYAFSADMSERDWRSLNIADKENYAELITVYKEGKLRSLHLGSYAVNTMKPVMVFDRINSLHVSHSSFSDLSELSAFKNLDTLVLNNCRFVSLLNMPVMPKLKYLNISANGIDTLTGITQCPALETLDLTANNIRDFRELNKLAGLKHLVLGTVSRMDYEQVQAQLPGISIHANITAD